jgi:hypothetical protein
VAADPSRRVPILQSTSRYAHSEWQFLVAFDPSCATKLLNLTVKLTKYNPTTIKTSNNAKEFLSNNQPDALISLNVFIYFPLSTIETCREWKINKHI